MAKLQVKTGSKLSLPGAKKPANTGREEQAAEAIIAPSAPPIDDDDIIDEASLHTPAEFEEVAAAEMSEVLSKFRQRAKAEDKRVQNATDSEYWIAIGFQTREQKHQFLQWLYERGVPTHENKYVNGLRVAKALGIAITAPTPPIYQRRMSDQLMRIADPLEQEPTES